MTTTRTMPLDAVWKSLAGKPAAPVHQLIDASHPLDLYAGVDGDGALLFVLITDEEPPEHIQSFAAIELTRYHRQDNRWALTVKLKKVELAKVFGHLCDDLVEASRSAPLGVSPSTLILERIARWERLLAHAGTSMLDELHLRGLVGELLFMERVGFAAREIAPTLRAWQGPLGGVQDFHFHDRSVEVKTTPAGSLWVRISSADQLETSGSPLFLSAFTLEHASRNAIGAFGLNEIVQRLKTHIGPDQADQAMFAERLACAGYVENPLYDEAPFLLTGMRHYSVGSDFPSLRRSQLPEAVGNLRYDLNLGLCAGFIVSTPL